MFLFTYHIACFLLITVDTLMPSAQCHLALGSSRVKEEGNFEDDLDSAWSQAIC